MAFETWRPFSFFLCFFKLQLTQNTFKIGKWLISNQLILLQDKVIVQQWIRFDFRKDKLLWILDFVVVRMTPSVTPSFSYGMAMRVWRIIILLQDWMVMAYLLQMQIWINLNLFVGLFWVGRGTEYARRSWKFLARTYENQWFQASDTWLKTTSTKVCKCISDFRMYLFTRHVSW